MMLGYISGTEILSTHDAQGDAGSRRAKYEARWHSFVTAPGERALKYEEVPWIMEGSAEDVKATILYGTSGGAPPALPPYRPVCLLKGPCSGCIYTDLFALQRIGVARPCIFEA